MTTSARSRYRAPRTKLLGALVAGLAAAIALTDVHAQSEASPKDAEPIAEIVVTGSRLRQTNLESDGPLATVSDQDIQLQGVSRVEDLLNSMPQVFADQASGLSNPVGTTGTATVNLRNLGSVRTLVLIDGSRLIYGDTGANPAPDLNNIPTSLVERVEVVTGGASAVYGSDAVAGVVNFIMKKNFDGIRLDTNYSLFQHSSSHGEAQRLLEAQGEPVPSSGTDGNVLDVTLLMGSNAADGRGNITAYAGYRRASSVFGDARDHSACTLQLAGANADEVVCGGSSTSFPGRFLSNDNGGGRRTLDADGNLIPFTSADLFNFNAYQYLQRPDERVTFGTFGHREVNDRVEIYGSLMFMNDETTGALAPSGLSGTFTVNCDNPFLTASQRDLWCRGIAATGDASLLINRRMVESGHRLDTIEHTTYRVTVGARGEIAPGWNYDVYGLYAAMDRSESYQNDLSLTRLRRALQAVDVAGTPTCRSRIDGTDPRCVPLNIFLPSGVTGEALDYLRLPLQANGSITEEIASGFVSVDLGTYGLQSPAANRGITALAGAEYRRETLERREDEAFESGDGALQPGPIPSISGSYDVVDYFFESRIPLITDRMLADSVSLSLAYRGSDYSLAGRTDAYKVQGEWAPTSDIRMRSGYNRAVRAPNAYELFLPQSLGIFSSTDPCANSDTTGVPDATLEECLLTGMTAAQYGNTVACPSGRCNQLAGGNTALEPEVADTTTVGIILTPRFLDGFTASVDYFHITIDGAISQVGSSFSLGQCLATGSPFLCGLINRSPTNGTLFGSGADAGYVSNTNVNAGSFTTSGLDIEARYSHEISSSARDFGTLSLNLTGTRTRSFIVEPIRGFGDYDCAGLYGSICSLSAAPLPRWRHKLNLDWQTPWDLDFRLSWRHIGAVELDINSGQPLLSSGVTDNYDARIGSSDYFDLSGQWRMGDNVTLRAGINNLLEEDPPFIADSAGTFYWNGNTYPGTWDALGRRFFLNVTLDL